MIGFVKRSEMKQLLAVGLVLGMALASNVAVAQSFEEQVSDMGLLQSKEVQTELGFTEQLRAKLNVHAEDFNKKANKLQEDYRKKAEGKNPPPPAPIAEMAKLESELKKKVMKDLSAAQLKRLSELTLQTAGFAAMLDETVSKKIGLTSAQLEKLRSAFKDNAQEAQRLQEGAMKPIYEKYGKEKPADEATAKELQAKVQSEVQAATQKIQPQIQALQEKFLKTLKLTVKAIQFNKFEALQGKPFKPTGSH